MDFDEEIAEVRRDFVVNLKKLAQDKGVEIDAATLRRLDSADLEIIDMCEIVRGLGFKLTAVLYDPPQVSGADILAAWQAGGSPRDFWELQAGSRS